MIIFKIWNQDDLIINSANKNKSNVENKIISEVDRGNTCN